MRFLATFPIMVCALAGCSRPHEFLPLKVGNQWRYKVNAGLDNFINTVEVVKTVPGEAGANFVLDGTLGTSLLAWKDGILRATSLAGDRFNPPLPMLDGNKTTSNLLWEGTVYASGKTYKASGTLVQEEGSVEVNSMKRKGLNTVLTLKFPDRSIKVESSYVRGIGLISQNQWTTLGTKEPFNRGLIYLAGP